MKKNHKIALEIAVFLALCHAVWLILVAVAPNLMTSYLNWATGLHGLSLAFLVTSVSWGQALTLVAISLVGGYLLGWLFALLVKQVKS